MSVDNPHHHPLDRLVRSIRDHLEQAPVRVESMEPAVARIMRDKSPTETLDIAFEFYRVARATVEAGVRHQQPELDDWAVSAEVARRMFGGPADLFPRRDRQG